MGRSEIGGEVFDHFGDDAPDLAQLQEIYLRRAERQAQRYERLHIHYAFSAAPEPYELCAIFNRSGSEEQLNVGIAQLHWGVERTGAVEEDGGDKLMLVEIVQPGEGKQADRPFRPFVFERLQRVDACAVWLQERSQSLRPLISLMLGLGSLSMQWEGWGAGASPAVESGETAHQVVKRASCVVQGISDDQTEFWRRFAEHAPTADVPPGALYIRLAVGDVGDGWGLAYEVPVSLGLEKIEVFLGASELET